MNLVIRSTSRRSERSSGRLYRYTEAARSTWAANVQWAGEALRSNSQVRSFPPTASDEPTGLGGSPPPPTPSSSCYPPWATASRRVRRQRIGARIAIKDLKIAVDGDVDLRSFLGLAPGQALSAIRVRVDLHTDADAKRWPSCTSVAASSLSATLFRRPSRSRSPPPD